MSPSAEPLAQALARCPAPDLDVDGLCAYVAGHGVDPATAAPDRLDDLTLSWACTQGAAAAVAAFSRDHAALIRTVGSRVLDPEALDDFGQRVLTHLLVSEPQIVPRIGHYGGRGPLRAFVRMVASRLAIDVRRADGKGSMRIADLDGQILEQLDPAEALESSEAKALLSEALARALRALRPVERRALRLRYVLGLSVARTAEALAIHEVSVSRLISRVRARVLEDVQQQLATAGGAPARDAWAALARSLDMSLARWLRTNVD